MNQLNLTVFCGGQSAEHDISLLSASNVLSGLDSQKYQVCVIYITRTGEWLVNQAYETASGPSQLSHLIAQTNTVLVTPRMGAKGAPWMMLDETRRLIPCDLVLPMLHGPRGEDGRLQGLLELLQLPYVGCDTLSCAICMDKDFSKQLVKTLGIATPRWMTIFRQTYDRYAVEKAVQRFSYPCYVKPANMGSSVGITKVKSKETLQEAIDLAFQYDDKILIEQECKGREIECAILGHHKAVASLPGEVIPLKEFYDYKSKYIDDNASNLVVPAKLSKEEIEAVQSAALRIYQTLNCSGMARVDFFLTSEGVFYFNEINTIPGFTNISLYPQCWNACGMPLNKLLDELIELAKKRWVRPYGDAVLPIHLT